MKRLTNTSFIPDIWPEMATSHFDISCCFSSSVLPENRESCTLKASFSDAVSVKVAMVWYLESPSRSSTLAPCKLCVCVVEEEILQSNPSWCSHTGEEEGGVTQRWTQSPSIHPPARPTHLAVTAVLPGPRFTSVCKPGMEGGRSWLVQCWWRWQWGDV